LSDVDTAVYQYVNVHW